MEASIAVFISLTISTEVIQHGVGVLLLFSDALELCPFGVGAYIKLVCFSGPQCKILGRPTHMTNQVL